MTVDEALDFVTGSVVTMAVLTTLRDEVVRLRAVTGDWNPINVPECKHEWAADPLGGDHLICLVCHVTRGPQS